MIIYNQAFDLYHTIFRVLVILDRFEEGTRIEIDRIRIWDFYLLFPDQVYSLRIKRKEEELRNIRKRFINKSKNPYEGIGEKRKVFEKIMPYQIAALNCLASYGIIDKSFLNQQRVVLINKKLIENFRKVIDEVSDKEKNIVSLMTGFFFGLSLFGEDGLKNRTDLLESKYDAE